MKNKITYPVRISYVHCERHEISIKDAMGKNILSMHPDNEPLAHELCGYLNGTLGAEMAMHHITYGATNRQDRVIIPEDEIGRIRERSKEWGNREKKKKSINWSDYLDLSLTALMWVCIFAVLYIIGLEIFQYEVVKIK